MTDPNSQPGSGLEGREGAGEQRAKGRPEASSKRSPETSGRGEHRTPFCDGMQATENQAGPNTMVRNHWTRSLQVGNPASHNFKGVDSGRPLCLRRNQLSDSLNKIQFIQQMQARLNAQDYEREILNGKTKYTFKAAGPMTVTHKTCTEDTHTIPTAAIHDDRWFVRCTRCGKTLDLRNVRERMIVHG